MFVSVQQIRKGFGNDVKVLVLVHVLFLTLAVLFSLI